MVRNYVGTLAVLFLSVLLTACNGSSGENGDNPFDPDSAPPASPEYSLTLTVLSQDCSSSNGNSFTLGEQICLQAQLLQDGIGANNQVISFTTQVGSLSSETKLTDANGIAEISISSVDANIGAGAVTADFSDETTATTNIEFIAAEPETDNTINVTIQLRDAQGNLINRFSDAQNINVSAQLSTQGDFDLTNQIVSFQTSNGELTLSDTLTNENAIASTQILTENAVFGAGTITASLQNDELTTAALNFEIFERDQVQEVVRIGSFANSVFNENVLGISGFNAEDEISISAGATLGVFVDLVDANDVPIASNIPISFTSNCTQQSAGVIDQSVTSINGRANATYEDISCATGNGNQDIIQASVFVDGNQLQISRIVNLLAESAGSIEFISASPDSIVLQGTGGQGSESVSLLTFQVTGAQGNPLAQQSVDFTLNTESGGLSLSPVSGLTNSQGQVSTRVTAGNVPTAIRVTASLTNQQGQTIQTQSDLLSVNTGLPDQNSISLAANNLNPEARNIQGQEVTITARLSDTFNNPVPDGTAVAFTTEAGSIQPSCTTSNGACSVIWTSSLPIAEDHRVTILATAIGHETLSDSNGNNVYDDQDGGAITDDDGSGFDVTLASQSGFIDLSEAWRDDNENRVRDDNEIFLDFDSSGSFNAQNGLFDGPQCDASNCGASSLHVRKSLVLITSSSSVLISVFNNGNEIINNQATPSSSPLLAIPRGESASFQLAYSDTQEQAIASGSTIVVEATSGALGGVTEDVMPVSNRAGARTSVFTIVNSLLEDDLATDSTISITITSPSGVQSNLNFSVTLQ
ncbi:Ig-like protein, group 1 [Glaciecola sp. KUL10]|uniref:Ig-like protein, group 1 n=1 Tax=Glaciecola sp. (strain KUL10) TaxID=2161813 RepID=UPI000D78410E|nr:Ig-like protein, group 1 [Glaciecola sp. KUL10]GBL04530.1 hypothetical protein KUL10_18360 [Glaciecola sp. KUL10]